MIAAGQIPSPTSLPVTPNSMRDGDIQIRDVPVQRIQGSPPDREPGANPILAPLMPHFISVVPPGWRFRFMGSTEFVEPINQSITIRQQVSAGKLDLTHIPSNMSTAGKEMISRFLTSLWLYETVLWPAEWLLVFQTDSILCGNGRQSLNEYLEYDWMRLENSEPEDTCGEAHSGAAVEIGKIPGADRPANYASDLEAAGAGEYVKRIDDRREGFHEPMGYHTAGGGTELHGSIWGTPEKRKQMWDYRPEVKMMLKMNAAEYVPGNCNQNWKRDGEQSAIQMELEAN
ncbi:hypothetical protein DL771_009808 [Monosporascus sp. 5C6A]|nr:hypothetical protein DL771_009808 [Monosporascus sp. 5C6A]